MYYGLDKNGNSINGKCKRNCNRAASPQLRERQLGSLFRFPKAIRQLQADLKYVLQTVWPQHLVTIELGPHTMVDLWGLAWGIMCHSISYSCFAVQSLFSKDASTRISVSQKIKVCYAMRQRPRTVQ